MKRMPCKSILNTYIKLKSGAWTPRQGLSSLNGPHSCSHTSWWMGFASMASRMLCCRGVVWIPSHWPISMRSKPKPVRRCWGWDSGETVCPATGTALAPWIACLSTYQGWKANGPTSGSTLIGESLFHNASLLGGVLERWPSLLGGPP